MGPDAVIKSEIFTGSLAMNEKSFAETDEEPIRPHLKLRESLNQLERVLDGYVLSKERTDAALSNYISAVTDKLLPAFEVEEKMSILRGRVDSSVTDSINSENRNYKKAIESGTNVEYPAERILKVLHEHAQSCASEQKNAFLISTTPLWTTVEQYLHPTHVRLAVGLINLIEMYLNVEKQFDDMPFTDVVSKLRKEHQANLIQVYNFCLSHLNINDKNTLLLRIVEEVKKIQPSSGTVRPQLSSNIPIRTELNLRHLKRRLTELSTLKQSVYSHVALSANLVLMEQYTLTIDQRRQRLNDVVTAALVTGDPVGTGDRAHLLKEFAESNIAIRDLLLESLKNDRDYQIAFIELYLRKIYQKTHNLANMSCGHTLTEDLSDLSPWMKFDFSTRTIDAVTGSQGSSCVLSYSDLASLSRSNNLSTAACSDSENEDEPNLPADSMGKRIGVFVALTSFEELTNKFTLVLEK